MTEDKSWNDLCILFLYNSFVLFDLMHEFEHVDQFDKVLNPDSSVESILLRLTHFPYTKINKESEISKFFIGNFQFFFDKDLHDLFVKFGVLNKVFGRDMLYERLADIRACEKINKLLEKVDADIEKVRNFFSADLVQYLLTGYDENSKIPFPMVNYIAGVKALKIPEVNEYIHNIVIPAISEVKSGYDRFTYGLYATDAEIKDLRKILS